MMSEMRNFVERKIESSKVNLTVEYAKQVIAQKEREISYWEDQYVSQKEFLVGALKGEITYFKAVIEVLEEMQEVAELEAASTTVQEVISEISSVISILRRFYWVAYPFMLKRFLIAYLIKYKIDVLIYRNDYVMIQFRDSRDGVVRLPFYERWEVVLMTTFEAISLMLTFGLLIIALLAYIDRNLYMKMLEKQAFFLFGVPTLYPPITYKNHVS